MVEKLERPALAPSPDRPSPCRPAFSPGGLDATEAARADFASPEPLPPCLFLAGDLLTPLRTVLTITLASFALSSSTLPVLLLSSPHTPPSPSTPSIDADRSAASARRSASAPARLSASMTLLTPPSSSPVTTAPPRPGSLRVSSATRPSSLSTCPASPSSSRLPAGSEAPAERLAGADGEMEDPLPVAAPAASPREGAGRG